MARFNLDDYLDVHERIHKFYLDFPHGSIQTKLVYHGGGEFIVQAIVYRNPFDPCPTTGWAREIEGESHVNMSSALENCETSAVGRALANMGYAVSTNRPSREEMLKALRMTKEHQEFIQHIYEVGKELSGAETLEDGTNLREHLRAKWPEAERHFKVARDLYRQLISLGYTREEDDSPDGGEGDKETDERE